MNANTIVAFKGGTLRNQMPVLSGDLSTATAAVIATDTVGTTSLANLKVPLQTAIVGSANPLGYGAGAILGPAYGKLFGLSLGDQAPYFTSDQFTGIPLRLRVHGHYTMGANGGNSALVQLAVGTSATIGSDVVIANTGAALACANTNVGDFNIVAEIVWSAATGGFGGRYSATIIRNAGSGGSKASQVISDVILPNGTTGFQDAAALSNLAFAVFFTAGNSAASTCQFQEFALEIV